MIENVFCVAIQLSYLMDDANLQAEIRQPTMIGAKINLSSHCLAEHFDEKLVARKVRAVEFNGRMLSQHRFTSLEAINGTSITDLAVINDGREAILHDQLIPDFIQ